MIDLSYDGKKKRKLLRAASAKLASRKGESLSETLVAMLVVALGSILLVTMVIAARNIIQKSEEAYDTFIAQHNALEGRKNAEAKESGTVTAEVETSDDVTVSLKDTSETGTTLLNGETLSESVTMYTTDGSDGFLYDAKPTTTPESGS